jgi:hypothetical protein
MRPDFGESRNSAHSNVYAVIALSFFRNRRSARRCSFAETDILTETTALVITTPLAAFCQPAIQALKVLS